MKRINKRGFTLVELLAAMVILGIIMAVAVPNIMGILNNSRASAYVEDAKKLMSLAEYKFRSDSSITKPSVGKCTVLTLNYLDNSEFENSPNSGSYNKHMSMVVIKNEGADSSNKYVYYVHLAEILDGDKTRGIALKSYDTLNNSKPSQLVSDNIGFLTVGGPSITLPDGRGIAIYSIKDDSGNLFCDIELDRGKSIYGYYSSK